MSGKECYGTRMRTDRWTIRKAAIALLVALVASFVLSAPADAAAKKPLRARTRHASRTTAAAKPAAKKKVTRKKKASAKGATTKKARKSVVKRKPATKPR